MTVSVLVGNPQAGSRTLRVASTVADTICRRTGRPRGPTMDLATVAEQMFRPCAPEVAAMNEAVAGSCVVVVASPTYKAAYTGLLKAFLDRYDTRGLASVVAVPVMTGGSPQHHLAPDTTLRPLLVELGAHVPTGSLYVMASQLDQLDALIQRWTEDNRVALDLLAYAGADE